MARQMIGTRSFLIVTMILYLGLYLVERCHLLQERKKPATVIFALGWFLDPSNRKSINTFQGGPVKQKSFRALIIRPTRNRRHEQKEARRESRAALFIRRTRARVDYEFAPGVPLVRLFSLYPFHSGFALVMKPRDANKLIGFTARLQLSAGRARALPSSPPRQETRNGKKKWWSVFFVFQ